MSDDKKDAERYRKLRDHGAGAYCVLSGQLADGEQLDALLDADGGPIPMHVFKPDMRTRESDRRCLVCGCPEAIPGARPLHSSGEVK